MLYYSFTICLIPNLLHPTPLLCLPFLSLFLFPCFFFHTTRSLFYLFPNPVLLISLQPPFLFHLTYYLFDVFHFSLFLNIKITKVDTVQNGNCAHKKRKSIKYQNTVLICFYYRKYLASDTLKIQILCKLNPICDSACVFLPPCTYVIVCMFFYVSSNEFVFPIGTAFVYLSKKEFHIYL